MNTRTFQTSQTRNAPARPSVALANTLGGMVRYAAGDAFAASAEVLMTFEAVATTTFGVVRHTWDGSYVEVLDISPEAVDLTRVTNGVCPLLANHNRWEFPESHLGAVDAARFEPGQLILSGRFDSGPEGSDVARRVNKDRTLRAVSIGYEPIDAVADGYAENGLPIVRITRWSLSELSFVLVPADPVSGSRNWGALPHPMLENNGAPETHNGGHQTMNRHALASASAVALLAAGAALQTRNQPQTGTSDAHGTLPRAPDAVRNVLSGLQTRDAAPAPAAPAPLQTRDDPAASSAAAAPAADASSDTPAAAVTMVSGATGTVSEGADGGLSVAVTLELRSQAERLGVAREAEAAMVRQGATAHSVRAAILAATAADQRAQVPNGGAARALTDESETFRARAMDGVILRANPALARTMTAEQISAAREFRGLSFERLAEDCLRARNEPTRGLSRNALIRSALSTSDFPNLLGGALNRTLRALYEAQPAVYREVAQRRSVADFRTQTGISLTGLGEMRRVAELGEPKRKDMAEMPETFALNKFEEIISISFEALVNDDLGAFQTLAPAMALMALATERRTFFSMFTPTGPTMADGTALWHVNHRNLITSSAGAPNIARLGAVRQALRMQTDAPVGVTGGNRINMPFKYILSPTTHETTLDQLFAARPQQDGAALARGDLLVGNLQSVIPIVDPMLDDNNAQNWYGLAPAEYGGFIYAYLEGEDGLVTEELPPGTVSAVSTKARLVFAAACLDWRAGVMYTG